MHSTSWSKNIINIIPVQYIFEEGACLMASRALWLVIVITAAGLGIHWSVNVGSNL